MGNPLFDRFNKFGNNDINSMQNNRQNTGGGLLNILNQYRQIQNDPGRILDVLLNNGKITQQQYNELQPMRDNPQQIVNYLASHGNSAQINQAQQLANAFGR